MEKASWGKEERDEEIFTSREMVVLYLKKWLVCTFVDRTGQLDTYLLGPERQYTT